MTWPGSADLRSAAPPDESSADGSSKKKTHLLQQKFSFVGEHRSKLIQDLVHSSSFLCDVAGCRIRWKSKGGPQLILEQRKAIHCWHSIIVYFPEELA
jgi:hypothetical protein